MATGTTNLTTFINSNADLVKTMIDNSDYTKDLVIPDNITRIVQYAFYSRTGFKGKLILPNTISSIDAACFSNCTGLTDVDCYRTTPTTIQSNSFNKVTANFYVPADNIYAYKTATNWVSFAVRIMGRKDYIIDDTFENFAQGAYTTTTWYASKEDLVAGTNPIASGTTVGATGTYYCTLT